MLNFRTVSISDKPIVDKYHFEFNSRSAEHNFGNIFMWSDGKRLIAEHASRLVVLNNYGGKKLFSFPQGNGELRDTVDAMIEYADENKFPFVMVGIEENGKVQLEELYPGRFVFEPVRDYSDYVYAVEKLSTLSGKKLHAKRNHINRFITEHEDWHFEEMHPEHFPACRQLFDEWAQAMEGDTESIDAERNALEIAYEHFDAMGLFGGVLFLSGKLVAFTIGEQCASDCVDTHFEKAADINGAYAMINHEFAVHIAKTMPHILYINREEDMGLENLRRAKQSYYPEFLIDKYTAYRRD